MFRGDAVKDESGFLASFSEQGASASRLEAAKMMDAMARFSLSDDPADECDGEEADAISAYTQAKLEGAETWITIPFEYWPASWKNKGYVRPMVRLLANLYGHPLAGLYWERHCHAALTKVGFT